MAENLELATQDRLGRDVRVRYVLESTGLKSPVIMRMPCGRRFSGAKQQIVASPCALLSDADLIVETIP